MHRRRFLAATGTTLLAAGVHADSSRERTVGVIGHTGRGNYGHGLDVVWKKVPGTRIVGVADASASGLKRALAKLGLKRGFADYRQMLKELQPEFVAVAPRHADQHLDMALAAIRAGARGIYLEKPFARTPAECDRILAAAQRTNTKIAVAHRNRYHPVLGVIDRFLAAGGLGRLLEIRGHGLGDRRGGGEDLWVLGSHVFNLFHYFGGEPRSCSGLVLQDGRPVTAADVKPGAEGLGPLAGNEIHARWLLAKGVVASYTTFTDDGSDKRGYAAHLVGTKGTISIHIDRDPVAWFAPGNPFDPASRANERVPVTTAGVGRKETRPETVAEVHNHVRAVRDLIAAVDEDRQPLCDGNEGAVTVEMICGVFESHRRGGAQIPYPLVERGNPLAKL